MWPSPHNGLLWCHSDVIRWWVMQCLGTPTPPPPRTDYMTMHLTCKLFSYWHSDTCIDPSMQFHLQVPPFLPPSWGRQCFTGCLSFLLFTSKGIGTTILKFNVVKSGAPLSVVFIIKQWLIILSPDGQFLLASNQNITFLHLYKTKQAYFTIRTFLTFSTPWESSKKSPPPKRKEKRKTRNQGFMAHLISSANLYIWGRFSVHLRPILADLIGSEASHDKINYLCLKCTENRPQMYGSASNVWIGLKCTDSVLWLAQIHTFEADLTIF